MCKEVEANRLLIKKFKRWPPLISVVLAYFFLTLESFRDKKEFKI